MQFLFLLFSFRPFRNDTCFHFCLSNHLFVPFDFSDASPLTGSQFPFLTSIYPSIHSSRVPRPLPSAFTYPVLRFTVSFLLQTFFVSPRRLVLSRPWKRFSNETLPLFIPCRHFFHLLQLTLPAQKFITWLYLTEILFRLYVLWFVVNLDIERSFVWSANQLFR